MGRGEASRLETTEKPDRHLSRIGTVVPFPLPAATGGGGEGGGITRDGTLDSSNVSFSLFLSFLLLIADITSYRSRCAFFRRFEIFTRVSRFRRRRGEEIGDREVSRAGVAFLFFRFVRDTVLNSFPIASLQSYPRASISEETRRRGTATVRRH